MSSCLIGYTGYVGTTLRGQRTFDAQFRSTDIQDIRGRDFDLVVGAGAPAQKWIANREPEADRARIDGLIEHLSKVTCRTFVLISTVDVFRVVDGVDEDAVVDTAGLHAYGLNRRRLEEFVVGHFSRALVVRLPGLVGPGLRKNVIYDLRHDNNLNQVESRNVFQFYPMVNLWYDVQTALDAGLTLVHLTAEPVAVAELARAGFNRSFTNELVNPLVKYDLRTKHAELFGGRDGYQYSRRESLQAVRAYAQTQAPR